MVIGVPGLSASEVFGFVVLLVLLVALVAVPVAAYRMAGRKGRTRAWALIVFLGPLGWIIGLAVLASLKPRGPAS